LRRADLIIFSDRLPKEGLERRQVGFLTEPIPQDWDKSPKTFQRRKIMETLRKILYIDSNWKVMVLLVRGGVLIKSMVTLETTLLLLRKQNFDLILTEPLNMAILTPQESIKNRVMDVLKVLTNKCSFEFLDSQTAMA
jgi:hypothetical protein